VKKDASIKAEIKMRFSLEDTYCCFRDFVLVALNKSRALDIGKLSISCLFPAWECAGFLL